MILASFNGVPHRYSCSFVDKLSIPQITNYVRVAVKVVMQNDGGCMEVKCMVLR